MRIFDGAQVVIEVVDTMERIDQLMPILDEMVTEGIVTVENIRVLKYSSKS